MLMLVVLGVAAILIPVLWIDKTVHEMHQIGWIGDSAESPPWGLIIVCAVITVALLSAVNI
jgi:hypothetical protein